MAYSIILGLHLLAMNVGSAGPLVSIWLHRRAKRGDAAADLAGRRIAWGSFWAFTLGVLLGAVCLAMVWHAGDSRYADALRQVPHKKYHFAAQEIVFSWALLLAYAGLWRRMKNWTNTHALLALLSVTNLLYHFPALLAMIALVARRPELTETMMQATTIAWLRHPEIGSRVAHVWLASIASAGIYTIWVALRLARVEAHRQDAPRLAVCGVRIALASTLAQLPVGLWVVFASSQEVQQAIMGYNLIATSLLALSVTLTFALLHVLATLSLGDFTRKAALRAMILFTVIVIAMTTTLKAIGN